MNLTYRKRFYSGDLNVRAGYTYEQEVDGRGNRFGEKASRSYLLARGLDPDEAVSQAVATATVLLERHFHPGMGQRILLHAGPTQA